MDVITTLPPLGIDILVLLLVVVIKSLVTRLSSYNGLSFFHFYCQQLANKVNKPNNSDSQRKVAGFIASLITLVPVLIILWLFENYVELSVIWHALLLYFSLGSFGHIAAAKRIKRYSEQQLKEQTRHELAPWVLRDVKQLSFMGMHKACIEMVQLRFIQHQFAIAMYFLLLGPYVALTVRMLIDMHHCWNPKKQAFQYFGLFVSWCSRCLLWAPTRLYIVALSTVNFNRPVLLSNKVPSNLLFEFNNKIALAALASIIDVKLGGVAMYDTEKKRVTEFNQQARVPSADDIERTINQLNLVKILSFGGLICVMIILALMPQT